MNVVRGGLVLLSVVAVLAGCAMDPKSPPTTSHEVPKDANLRPVTMAYKDGLAYTYEETSAQALCHALSPQEWQALLGGEVGRTVEIDGWAECVVTSSRLTVTMAMKTTEPDLPPRERQTESMGGYPAWTERDEAVVDLVAGPHTTRARPYLHVRVGAATIGDHRDLVRNLVTTLLTRLAHDGPMTPVEDAGGTLAFTPTEPVPGVRFFDLPRPVQALVLCTAMTRTGGPHVTKVNMAGECAADGIGERRAAMNPDDDNLPVSFKVGGRPARFTKYGAVAIDLDDLPLDDSRRVYLRLVVEWPGAGHEKAKSWADQFVERLGEL
jgi:hypothetical protein